MSAPCTSCVGLVAQDYGLNRNGGSTLYAKQLRTARSATPSSPTNDYAVWNAFANHYWPALYFVDREGLIRDQHFGEARYEKSERVIKRLLGVERELVSVEGLDVEAAGDWDHLRIPETYLGYWRTEGSGVLQDGRLYQLVRVRDTVRQRSLKITFDEPVAEAYTFTFG